MENDKQGFKTQTVAYGWQLVIPENTIVMDNKQGNIAIEDASDNFRGGPLILLTVSANQATVESSGYFEQGISITLDKKIVITKREAVNMDEDN
ncbi:hypothetical protein [Leuconostoc gasicomitatum]|uniref:hypothetical protein n=1 Tax=Leuconostoc gasicomitatum TaxID=115778 RepID=UPI001CC54776|nr:hypothetical protein [Leuconostoc gasicomitatum]MBZ5961471.1 hypothetical protein [Leuconostoc gasicomitatum]MBZ5970554.1 hypothetical protein [Leuconostoc gasicomitatum]MBZ5993825.1 hypothetical protein [Leuconostoc gasicomitatum]MBZ5997193.1 hypothetical protein [Leuconostoc gasicomitatum]